jgi:hypothetical protein
MTTTEILTALGGYAITGAVVSTIVQYTKDWLASRPVKMIYTFGISIIGGIVLYSINFVSANYIAAILGVWASANTVYLVIYKPLQSPK